MGTGAAARQAMPAGSEGRPSRRGRVGEDTGEGGVGGVSTQFISVIIGLITTDPSRDGGTGPASDLI